MGEKVYRMICGEHNPKFDYWDINIPLSQRLGTLEF